VSRLPIWIYPTLCTSAKAFSETGLSDSSLASRGNFSHSRGSAAVRRIEGKQEASSGRRCFDTSRQKSCIRQSRRWSTICGGELFLDSGAPYQHRTRGHFSLGVALLAVAAKMTRAISDQVMKGGSIFVQDAARRLVSHYGRQLLVIFVVVLLVHDIFGPHGFLVMRRKQQEIQKVNAAMDKLNKENADLEQQVKDLKSDPQTIRKIAREELGLAQPGEIIIKLPAPPPPEIPTAKP